MIKKVKIGSSVFTVKEVSPISNTEDLWGRVIPTAREILLDKTMCPAQKTQTLMHEVVHAISREICLDLGGADTDRLSKLLIQIIKDNHGLVKMITED